MQDFRHLFDETNVFAGSNSRYFKFCTHFYIWKYSKENIQKGIWNKKVKHKCISIQYSTNQGKIPRNHIHVSKYFAMDGCEKERPVQRIHKSIFVWLKMHKYDFLFRSCKKIHSIRLHFILKFATMKNLYNFNIIMSQ